MAVDPNMYVIKPFFKAESFDEMVKPLTLAAAAYKEQEAKLEDMTDKASALEWIANRDPNSQTAALYREMSDKIQGIRDDIMMNGFHGGIRPSILDTRKIYSANSAEITRRYNDMVEYQKRMEQLSDKDNSMVFSTDSQNISIDDFAGGRRPKIKAISGNEIMARGAAIGKRLTSQIFGDGVEGQVMGGQFWKTYKEQGMTDPALRQALKDVGKSDKYAMVKEVIDGVYNSFNGFSPDDQRQLKNRFIEGVYSGAVYARDVNYQANEDHMNPLESEQILSSQTSRRLAENQDARATEEHALNMIAAGAKWDDERKRWDTSGITAESLNAINSKSKSSKSSSGSGSGGNEPVFADVYMTGNDNYLKNIRKKEGAWLAEDSNESVVRGTRVTMVPNGDGSTMTAMVGSVPIATYNKLDGTLNDVGNKDDVRAALGINGDPFYNNRWRKSDNKLLRNLCKRACDIYDQTGAQSLNNYEFLFQSDGTDPREGWNYAPFIKGGNNGSISVIAKERAKPTGSGNKNPYGIPTDEDNDHVGG